MLFYEIFKLKFENSVVALLISIIPHYKQIIFNGESRYIEERI